MREQVLVVEDDRELRDFLVEVLSEAGYTALGHGTAEQALRALHDEAGVDLVVTDLIMPGMSGQDLLRQVRTQRPDLHVIIITAFGSIDSAIESVKSGAFEYLTKPFSAEELLFAVQSALTESRPRRELARQYRTSGAVPHGFIGASRPALDLLEMVRRVAVSRYPVLITGESGTGKELIARGIHSASGRDPFVPVNCAALPENLLESELFGHERGAFTGADRARKGLLEAASGGSLFMDEIGELPLALQPKLLRAIETGEVRPVGSTLTRSFDVRLITATNRDIEAEVREGRFREDLFWRLNVLHVEVPPLRDRPTDIPLLVEHFLNLSRRRAPGDPADALQPRRLAPDTLAMLNAYPWPGNIRELRNAIERASAMATGPEIQPDDLPERIREAGRTASLISGASRRQLPLREVERAYILEVLRQAGGNKSRAAALLGLDRKTLYRKLEEYAQGDTDNP